MIVVLIIGILAAIAIPLYSNIQAKARIGKAQADARALGSAVSMYFTHMGSLPASLTTLTSSATNADGMSIGALIVSTPTPPLGWSAYVYSSSSPGVFSISSSGDGITVSLP